MGLIEDKFSLLGGNFLLSEEEISKHLQHVSVFIFDWDGVFNDGFKNSERGSGFSEIDSMGINMLRFNHWRIHKKNALVFIITGENNAAAIEFANREHFHAIYLGYKDKRKALEHIAKTHDVSYDDMAFVFDDVLDLGIANLCKVSFCVNRKASPLFKEYIVGHVKCAYITAHEGSNHAVREISELVMGLTGQYEETITRRIEYGEDYTQYITQRNLLMTAVESFKS